MPKLENWSVGCNNFNPYQAPECQDKVLYGEVYDDEKQRFKDGVYIMTSSIIELDIKNRIAQTSNTKYILGNPSKEYLNWLKENNMSLDQFIKKETTKSELNFNNLEDYPNESKNKYLNTMYDDYPYNGE